MKQQVKLKCVVGPPHKPNYLVCEVRSKRDECIKTYTRKLPATFDSESPDKRDDIISTAAKSIMVQVKRRYNLVPGYLWPI